ncbi:uncharacterized protein LOC115889835 [Sitophilus oryzae]|uniref:Uncharacterized protein LOC115889835 n=1 Tax=Sitophilus oryzae TaxID=7048 RepID=A0A6J2YR83_SITOR|nr:uncharacterized protein LOC115889835 [Sitophilus oryzae]
MDKFQIIMDQDLEQKLKLTPATSQNAKTIAQCLKRSITESIRSRYNIAPEFAERMQQNVLRVHEYYCRVTDREGKYPYGVIRELILSYIKLELEVLKHPIHDHGEYHEVMKDRILFLLCNIYSKFSDNSYEIWREILAVLNDMPVDVHKFFDDIVDKVKENVRKCELEISRTMNKPPQLTCCNSYPNSSSCIGIYKWNEQITDGSENDVITILDDDDDICPDDTVAENSSYPLKPERCRNNMSDDVYDTGQHKATTPLKVIDVCDDIIDLIDDSDTSDTEVSKDTSQPQTQDSCTNVNKVNSFNSGANAILNQTDPMNSNGFITRAQLSIRDQIKQLVENSNAEISYEETRKEWVIRVKDTNATIIDKRRGDSQESTSMDQNENEKSNYIYVRSDLKDFSSGRKGTVITEHPPVKPSEGQSQQVEENINNCLNIKILQHNNDEQKQAVPDISTVIEESELNNAGGLSENHLQDDIGDQQQTGLNLTFNQANRLASQVNKIENSQQEIADQTESKSNSLNTSNAEQLTQVKEDIKDNNLNVADTISVLQKQETDIEESSYNAETVITEHPSDPGSNKNAGTVESDPPCQKKIQVKTDTIKPTIEKLQKRLSEPCKEKLLNDEKHIQPVASSLSISNKDNLNVAMKTIKTVEHDQSKLHGLQTTIKQNSVFRKRKLSEPINRDQSQSHTLKKAKGLSEKRKLTQPKNRDQSQSRIPKTAKNGSKKIILSKSQNQQHKDTQLRSRRNRGIKLTQPKNRDQSQSRIPKTAKNGSKKIILSKTQNQQHKDTQLRSRRNRGIKLTQPKNRDQSQSRIPKTAKNGSKKIILSKTQNQQHKDTQLRSRRNRGIKLTQPKDRDQSQSRIPKRAKKSSKKTILSKTQNQQHEDIQLSAGVVDLNHIIVEQKKTVNQEIDNLGSKGTAIIGHTSDLGSTNAQVKTDTTKQYDDKKIPIKKRRVHNRTAERDERKNVLKPLKKRKLSEDINSQQKIDDQTESKSNSLNTSNAEQLTQVKEDIKDNNLNVADTISVLQKQEIDIEESSYNAETLSKNNLQQDIDEHILKTKNSQQEIDNQSQTISCSLSIPSEGQSQQVEGNINNCLNIKNLQHDNDEQKQAVTDISTVIEESELNNAGGLSENHLQDDIGDQQQTGYNLTFNQENRLASQVNKIENSQPEIDDQIQTISNSFTVSNNAVEDNLTTNDNYEEQFLNIEKFSTGNLKEDIKDNNLNVADTISVLQKQETNIEESSYNAETLSKNNLQQDIDEHILKTKNSQQEIDNQSQTISCSLSIPSEGQSQQVEGNINNCLNIKNLQHDNDEQKQAVTDISTVIEESELNNAGGLSENHLQDDIGDQQQTGYNLTFNQENRLASQVNKIENSQPEIDDQIQTISNSFTVSNNAVEDNLTTNDNYEEQFLNIENSQQEIADQTESKSNSLNTSNAEQLTQVKEDIKDNNLNVADTISVLQKQETNIEESSYNAETLSKNNLQQDIDEHILKTKNSQQEIDNQSQTISCSLSIPSEGQSQQVEGNINNCLNIKNLQHDNDEQKQAVTDISTVIEESELNNAGGLSENHLQDDIGDQQQTGYNLTFNQENRLASQVNKIENSQPEIDDQIQTISNSFTVSNNAVEDNLTTNDNYEEQFLNIENSQQEIADQTESKSNSLNTSNAEQLTQVKEDIKDNNLNVADTISVLQKQEIDIEESSYNAETLSKNNLQQDIDEHILKTKNSQQEIDNQSQTISCSLSIPSEGQSQQVEGNINNCLNIKNLQHDNDEQKQAVTDISTVIEESELNNAGGLSENHLQDDIGDQQQTGLNLTFNQENRLASQVNKIENSQPEIDDQIQTISNLFSVSNNAVEDNLTTNDNYEEQFLNIENSQQEIADQTESKSNSLNTSNAEQLTQVKEDIKDNNLNVADTISVLQKQETDIEESSYNAETLSKNNLQQDIDEHILKTKNSQQEIDNQSQTISCSLSIPSEGQSQVEGNINNCLNIKNLQHDNDEQKQAVTDISTVIEESELNNAGGLSENHLQDDIGDQQQTGLNLTFNQENRLASQVNKIENSQPEIDDQTQSVSSSPSVSNEEQLTEVEASTNGNTLNVLKGDSKNSLNIDGQETQAYLGIKTADKASRSFYSNPTSPLAMSPAAMAISYWNPSSPGNITESSDVNYEVPDYRLDERIPDYLTDSKILLRLMSMGQLDETTNDLLPEEKNVSSDAKTDCSSTHNKNITPSWQKDHNYSGNPLLTGACQDQDIELLDFIPVIPSDNNNGMEDEKKKDGSSHHNNVSFSNYTDPSIEDFLTSKDPKVIVESYKLWDIWCDMSDSPLSQTHLAEVDNQPVSSTPIENFSLQKQVAEGRTVNSNLFGVNENSSQVTGQNDIPNANIHNLPEEKKKEKKNNPRQFVNKQKNNLKSTSDSNMGIVFENRSLTRQVQEAIRSNHVEGAVINQLPQNTKLYTQNGTTETSSVYVPKR